MLDRELRLEIHNSPYVDGSFPVDGVFVDIYQGDELVAQVTVEMAQTTDPFDDPKVTLRKTQGTLVPTVYL